MVDSVITLASYIDHTLLVPTATHIEIEKICNEALEYGFAAVCVPPSFVGAARRAGVRTATVIGFPFGYSVTQAKLAEVRKAIADGADELDVVINLGDVKEGNWLDLEAEIIRCCAVYALLGVDFLKTSTGYAERGATVAAVRLMRAHLPAAVRIKASGGIRDAGFALELIAAGADRLGCSASVKIVTEYA